jgi:hypothetical protein
VAQLGRRQPDRLTVALHLAEHLVLIEAQPVPMPAPEPPRPPLGDIVEVVEVDGRAVPDALHPDGLDLPAPGEVGDLTDGVGASRTSSPDGLDL